MRYEAESLTTAPPEQLWAVLVDVEAWPRFLSTYKSVRRLDDGPLAVGSRAEVRQPGLVAATFTVSALEPGREFTWESTAAGVRTVARHVVEPGDAGGSRIVLSLDQSGALARLVGLLLGGKIWRYVETEARGLCRAAESVPGA
jgi:uncharacterized membrane protein